MVWAVMFARSQQGLSPDVALRDYCAQVGLLTTTSLRREAYAATA
jgi:hypothetical protein